MAIPDVVTALAYNPPGSLLAVVCKDHSVRLWDTSTHLPVGPPLLHAAEVLAVHFAPDGRELVTASAAGEVRRWPLPEVLPDDPARLDVWLQAWTGRKRT